MSIKYEPKKILKKMASKKKVEELVTDKLTVNRAALNGVQSVGVLSKKQLEFVALNVIKKYREKAEALTEEGLTKSEAREEVLENKKLLLQRVNMAILWETTQKIKELYAGEKYRWLESTSEEKNKKHKRKVGKIFTIGKGEMPQDNYGCKCGMEILVDAKRLNIKKLKDA